MQLYWIRAAFLKTFMQLSWRYSCSLPKDIHAAFLNSFRQLSWRYSCSFAKDFHAAFLKTCSFPEDMHLSWRFAYSYTKNIPAAFLKTFMQLSWRHAAFLKTFRLLFWRHSAFLKTFRQLFDVNWVCSSVGAINSAIIEDRHAASWGKLGHLLSWCHLLRLSWKHSFGSSLQLVPFLLPP